MARIFDAPDGDESIKAYIRTISDHVNKNVNPATINFIILFPFIVHIVRTLITVETDHHTDADLNVSQRYTTYLDTAKRELPALNLMMAEEIIDEFLLHQFDSVYMRALSENYDDDDVIEAPRFLQSLPDLSRMAAYYAWAFVLDAWN